MRGAKTQQTQRTLRTCRCANSQHRCKDATNATNPEKVQMCKFATEVQRRSKRNEPQERADVYICNSVQNSSKRNEHLERADVQIRNRGAKTQQTQRTSKTCSCANSQRGAKTQRTLRTCRCANSQQKCKDAANATNLENVQTCKFATCVFAPRCEFAQLHVFEVRCVCCVFAPLLRICTSARSQGSLRLQRLCTSVANLHICTFLRFVASLHLCCKFAHLHFFRVRCVCCVFAPVLRICTSARS